MAGASDALKRNGDFVRKAAKAYKSNAAALKDLPGLCPEKQQRQGLVCLRRQRRVCILYLINVVLDFCDFAIVCMFKRVYFVLDSLAARGVLI